MQVSLERRDRLERCAGRVHPLRRRLDEGVRDVHRILGTLHLEPGDRSGSGAGRQQPLVGDAGAVPLAFGRDAVGDGGLDTRACLGHLRGELRRNENGQSPGP